MCTSEESCIGAFGGLDCGTVGRCVLNPPLVGVDGPGMNIQTDMYNFLNMKLQDSSMLIHAKKEDNREHGLGSPRTW